MTCRDVADLGHTHSKPPASWEFPGRNRNSAHSREGGNPGPRVAAWVWCFGRADAGTPLVSAGRVTVRPLRSYRLPGRTAKVAVGCVRRATWPSGVASGLATAPLRPAPCRAALDSRFRGNERRMGLSRGTNCCLDYDARRLGVCDRPDRRKWATSAPRPVALERDIRLTAASKPRPRRILRVWTETPLIPAKAGIQGPGPQPGSGLAGPLRSRRLPGRTAKVAVRCVRKGNMAVRRGEWACFHPLTAGVVPKRPGFPLSRE
ncbi:hypothetical protein AB7M35_000478 [Amorphus suaedae]